MSDTEKRVLTDCEMRISEDGDGPPKIAGYAALFGVLTDIGGFREKIRKGAFKKALKAGADVRGLLNHNPDLVLGRTAAGTMRVWEDSRGLQYEITPPDTQAGRDAVESIRRGDITGSSFAFRTIEDRWCTVDGEEVRELIEVVPLDVSPATYPAYPDTTAAVRSRDAFRRSRDDGQARSRRLQAVEAETGTT